VGEGKMEEMDRKGWKKLTAVGFFFYRLFVIYKDCNFSPFEIPLPSR
jgi:hypothetical protein